MHSTDNNLSSETNLIRVLIVDDDEDDYFLTEELLIEAYGKNIDIQWAASYEKAIKQADTNPFDIFLVDYRLGAKTGIEFTKEITQNTFVVNPVILLTGFDSHKVDLEATQSGAMDYLVKSELNANLLERAIRYALNRKRIEEKLIQLAQHDPLTGLANRAKFSLALTDKIQEAKREQAEFAVLLLDLDNFKEINDTLGHSVGDSLLKSTANRITHSLRDVDIIARLGGDEFAIIAKFAHLGDGASHMAARLNKSIAEEISVDGHPIKTSASIGIAIYPHDGTTSESLLKSADMAMYKSKRSGKGQYRYFDPAYEEEVSQNRLIKTELHNAVKNQEFSLYYQPIINIVTGQVEKAEALIRWQHPSLGLLSPHYFIGVAETEQVILDIGHWVIEQACKDCAKWQNEYGLTDLGICINLSARQFNDEKLVNTLKEQLNSVQLKAKHLTLEITESTIMSMHQGLIDRLHDLEKMGIELAIDDFGTGYSSLTYLKRLPVSTLKVDQSFVADINENDDDKMISKAIIHLGQSMNKKVIAEGIEEKSQLDILKHYGCELIQGFHYAKPMTFSEFMTWNQNFKN